MIEKNTNVTLEEIAQIVGVSRSTVSRALNDSPLISRNTKRRVKQVADSLGYVPNVLARGLKNEHTELIAVILSSVVNPFVTDIVQGIEDMLERNSYKPIYFDSNGTVEKEIKHIYSARQLKVDGMIIITTQSESSSLSRLLRGGYPVVFLDNIIETDFADYVTVDNYLGAKLAVEYLLSIGHTDIQFIGGPTGVYVNERRKEGYVDALKNVGLEPRLEWTCKGGFLMEHGYDVACKLIQAGDIASALFCVSDSIAIGVMRAFTEKGIRVPQDVSIVGYDDLPIARYLPISLTSVEQPKLEMGRVAAERLINRINGSLCEDYQKIVLEPQLIIRETTLVRH